MMNAILSAVNVADLLAPDAPLEPSSPWLTEILIIIGLLLSLFCVALMIIWVFRERKPAIVAEQGVSHVNSGSTGRWGTFISKRRHRKYKKRFPTLAEKGGLPPKKEEQTEESARQV